LFVRYMGVGVAVPLSRFLVDDVHLERISETRG
jgi:hypothetical protein